MGGGGGGGGGCKINVCVNCLDYWKVNIFRSNKNLQCCYILYVDYVFDELFITNRYIRYFTE